MKFFLPLAMLATLGLILINISTSPSKNHPQPTKSHKKTVLALVKTPEKNDNPNGLIQLPLRVRIITNIDLERKGTKMNMWVTPDNFKTTILPEINKIWKAANIQWVLEDIREQPAADLPNKDKLATYIQNSSRNGPKSKTAQRIPNLHRLSGSARGHSVIHNLYLFPYIGQTYQGVAALGGNWALSLIHI